LHCQGSPGLTTRRCPNLKRRRPKTENDNHGHTLDPFIFRVRQISSFTPWHSSLTLAYSHSTPCLILQYPRYASLHRARSHPWSPVPQLSQVCDSSTSTMVGITTVQHRMSDDINAPAAVQDLLIASEPCGKISDTSYELVPFHKAMCLTSMVGIPRTWARIMVWKWLAKCGRSKGEC
jgi:hypothetical protein